MFVRQRKAELTGEVSCGGGLFKNRTKRGVGAVMRSTADGRSRGPMGEGHCATCGDPLIASRERLNRLRTRGDEGRARGHCNCYKASCQNNTAAAHHTSIIHYRVHSTGRNTFTQSASILFSTESWRSFEIQLMKC